MVQSFMKTTAIVPVSECFTVLNFSHRLSLSFIPSLVGSTPKSFGVESGMWNLIVSVSDNIYTIKITRTKGTR